MAENTNKIEFGVENLHLAQIQQDNTYGTPEKIAGVTTIKLEAKGEMLNIFADNGIYHNISSNAGYDIELEIYNYDDDFKVKYLGFKKDKNGVLVEPSILNPAPIALLFKAKGDLKDRCFALYKCTFEKPSVEYKTVEDKIEVPVMTLKGKASPQSFTGLNFKVIQSSTTDATKAATWFTTVYVPTNGD